MNIVNISKSDCCGCSSCKAVCPVKAITFVRDEEGFLYPQVSDSCIDCGLCYQTCLNKQKSCRKTINAYAAKHRDDSVLKHSSSGGMSHALCEYIIKIGGIVYGVACIDDYQVAVIRANSIEECELLYGSKYVQADPKDSFLMVYDDLIKGKHVVYFGTSCLIAGLLSFLNVKNCDKDKLITVDIICHGVPSPRLFNDYIQWLGKKLVSYEFRTKNKPWGYGSSNYGCTITKKDGLGRNKKEVDTVRARVFLKLFFSNNCLRPYCYQCEYAGINRPSDITLGDFWGLKESHPDFFDEKGVSSVLINTEKGQTVFDKLENVISIQTTVQDIIKYQGNLNHPSEKASSRDAFWSLYKQKGFSAIAKVYGGWKLKNRIKSTSFYRKVRKIIRG